MNWKVSGTDNLHHGIVCISGVCNGIVIKPLLWLFQDTLNNGPTKRLVPQEGAPLV